MRRPPHRFVELFDKPTDLEDWIADFSAREADRPRVGPFFPPLGAAELPFHWFVDQFDRLSDEEGKRDQLRTVIIRLIATHGGRRGSAQTRDQIVGTLLQVARELKFTEIVPLLRDWVRKPWFREEHLYKLGSAAIPLSRTVWELLFAWGPVDSLITSKQPDLLKELALSGQTGTAQIAFVALGEHDIDAALLLIPEVVKVWPLAYWVSTVAQFLRSVDAKVLLHHDHLKAWTTCVGRCMFKDDIDRYIRMGRPFTEADANRINYFPEAVESAGLLLDDTENGYVKILGDGASLTIDVWSYFYTIQSSAAIRAEPISVQDL